MTTHTNNRVMIYRNLTKGCWSVKALATGRVILHMDTIAISNGTFKVSERGRQRVLREKKKYVHAGVVGIIENVPNTLDGWSRVRYNPYTTSTFVDLNNSPIHTAEKVYLDSDGRVYIKV